MLYFFEEKECNVHKLCEMNTHLPIARSKYGLVLSDAVEVLLDSIASVFLSNFILVVIIAVINMSD